MTNTKTDNQQERNLLFAIRLNQIMKENEISQTTMANYIGCTRQAISQYTSGKNLPNIEVLFHISKFLNVTTDWLVGLSNAKTHDASIQSISKKTGLSEKAIINISNDSFALEDNHTLKYHFLYFTYLNKVLEHEKFTQIVTSLQDVYSTYKSLMDYKNANVNNEDTLDEYKSMHAFYLWTIETKFTSIVSDVVKDVYEEEIEVNK